MSGPQFGIAEMLLAEENSTGLSGGGELAHRLQFIVMSLWEGPSGVCLKRYNRSKKGWCVMLSWALTFLVIALIAAVLGFSGIAGTAAGIAKILFVVFLVLFLVSLIAPRLRPPVA